MAYIEEIELQSGTAYRVQFNVQGKRYRKYFPPNTPKRSVELWVKQKELEIEQQRINGAVPSTQKIYPTLQDFGSIYKEKRSIEISVKRNLHSYKLLINYLGPHLTIDKVTDERLESFRNSLLEQRLAKIDQDDFLKVQRARRGANKELSCLRDIFSWAKRKKYIPINPFDDFEFFSATKPVPNILPREKEKEFYKNLPKSNIRIIFLFLRYAGLRRSECLELRERNILLKEGYIKLEKNKNREIELIPMHQIIQRMIIRAKLLTGNPDKKLFNNNKDAVSRTFRRTLDKIGLEHIKSPAHMLRHTFGLRIMENEISDKNERLAQEMLRHKTGSMTKHYTQIARENLKKRFDKLKI